MSCPQRRRQRLTPGPPEASPAICASVQSAAAAAAAAAATHTHSRTHTNTRTNTHTHTHTHTSEYQRVVGREEGGVAPPSIAPTLEVRETYHSSHE